jgi:hypothetical protein
MCNLDTDEALKIHIEGLQSTLGKRNARIKELEAKLAEPVDLPEKIEKMISKAYKQGWKDCASKLMDSTKEAAIKLGAIRKDAFDYYLKGEDIDRFDV